MVFACAAVFQRVSTDIEALGRLLWANERLHEFGHDAFQLVRLDGASGGDKVAFVVDFREGATGVDPLLMLGPVRRDEFPCNKFTTHRRSCLINSVLSD